jgi:hypothetical protein
MIRCLFIIKPLGKVKKLAGFMGGKFGKADLGVGY